MSEVSHFKDRQSRLVESYSKERKQQEEARRKQLERDYYEDINWQIDVAYDGSDSQPYETEEE